MTFSKIIKSTVTLLSIAMIFAGLSAFAAPQVLSDATADGDDYTLSGIVVDAESNEPISGVLVGMIGNQDVVETTSDGTFVFESVSEGEHTLIFQADGYEYTEIEVEVAGEDTQVEVALKKAE
ncbi:MAG: carboxypeptidase-like regulatory domain-containing protein [Balneolia bacterium]|nr:carboxypeptidase-like regulatory domain-containing protein [Balneolia bacterium]